jgi:predicted dehydrogenase
VSATINHPRSTINEPLRIGLIGLGFMGATHIKAWRQVAGARIAALCSPSGHHLDGDFSDVSGNVGDKAPIKLEMTGVAAYRDYGQMLADPSIDAIDICTPTHTHLELVLAALAAGKHVICEKPMARTSAEAKRMVEVASKANRILMPAMCLRFWPEWAWLKEAVSSGRYGKVLSARFTRIAEPPGWGRSTFLDGAKSGGALLDLHIHDTDFVNYLFGKPLSVQSHGYSLLSGCIDHVVTRYEVECGALVHAEGGWTMAKGFGFRMAYTVNFAKATADYDLARGKEALRLSEDGETKTITCDGPDGYVGQLTHFTQAIRNGKQPTVVTAEDGALAVEICEAEERSIVNG